MKTLKLMIVAVVGLLPMVGNSQTAAPTVPVPQAYATVQPNHVPTAADMLLTTPTPNWYLIRGDAGPTIPAGWTVINIEAVIYQGNSITRWLVYLYNPSTRQTYGWLIGL